LGKEEDGPDDEETEAMGALVGRAMQVAMKGEDFAALTEFMVQQLPVVVGTESPAPPAPVVRSLAWNLARLVWNVAPLPSEGYRPRPIALPERNDRCPCGSGQKFKKCCGLHGHAFPAIAEDEAWTIVAGELDVAEASRLLRLPDLPPRALGPLAERLKDRGESQRAADLLGKALGAAGDLDERYEGALRQLIEIDLETNGLHSALDHVRRLEPRLPPSVRGSLYLELASSAGEDFATARELLEKARQEAPDDPSLGLTEVMLTIQEGDFPRASERARFWLAWMRRRGLAGQMPDAVEFLEKAARDPESAADDLSDDTVSVVPIFAAELQEMVAQATKRPIRPYALDEVDGSLVFSQRPKALEPIERRWSRTWPVAKPMLTSLDIDPPVEVYKQPRPWLDLLNRHPSAFDSLEILDDLVLLVAPIALEINSALDRPLLAPLIERALAIVRASLEQHPAPARLEWRFAPNRPALRLLTQAGVCLDRLGRAGEAAELFEWILRLNPSDNHAHRAWLVNYHLKAGENERALAVSLLHDDDILVDTRFGRGLALWRLGRTEEAKAQLSAAARETPATARALIAKKMREPEMSPYGVTVGGEDEAWLYREEMLETWRATPGILQFLADVPLPEPSEPRRRRSSPASRRRKKDPEGF
jgi:tetratricopeptide (TPR) repeat protein